VEGRPVWSASSGTGVLMIVLLILLTAILTAAVVWFFSYRAGFEHGYAEGWQVALERGRRFGIMQAIDTWKTKAGFSSGSDGWKFTGDGDAEFNNVTMRGAVEEEEEE